MKICACHTSVCNLDPTFAPCLETELVGISEDAVYPTTISMSKSLIIEKAGKEASESVHWMLDEAAQGKPITITPRPIHGITFTPAVAIVPVGQTWSTPFTIKAAGHVKPRESVTLHVLLTADNMSDVTLIASGHTLRIATGAACMRFSLCMCGCDLIGC